VAIYFYPSDENEGEKFIKDLAAKNIKAEEFLAWIVKSTKPV
jgi:hypothetical protein